jgi:hypothetical protein
MEEMFSDIDNKPSQQKFTNQDKFLQKFNASFNVIQMQETKPN